MESEKIRILLCDDHAVVRAGLAAILGYEDDFEVVGQASDGQEAVDKAVELRPDVVVMDLMMPKLDGTQATAELLKAVPEAKVLVLTSFASGEDVRRVMAAGAAGALPKTVSNERLVESIRAVRAGGRALAPEFAKSAQAAEPATELTPRQLEVLKLLSKGLTNKDIARHFDISVNGVKRHLEHLFERLGVSTRAEAVAIALRDQLLKI